MVNYMIYPQRNKAYYLEKKHFSDLEKYSALLTVPMMIYIGVSLLYCLVASAFVAFTVSCCYQSIRFCSMLKLLKSYGFN